MKGKIRNLILALVVMLGLLATFTQTESAHAWPWSSRTTVEVSVVKPGNYLPGAVRCFSGALVVNGQTYYGSVSNPWYSTKCTVTFYSVPVNTNADITVYAQYRGANKLARGQRWVPKPWVSENVTVADLYIN